MVKNVKKTQSEQMKDALTNSWKVLRGELMEKFESEQRSVENAREFLQAMSTIEYHIENVEVRVEEQPDGK